MFDVQILGMDMYRILHTFVLFSFLGYLMECVVLSIEKKRLVLDRGFMKGPFCIIYGFGALIIPALLRPFSHNLFLLFAAGMLLATVLEYLTGIAMMRLFGSLWWDYSHKPFNYKGILCLESSVGWGVLAVLYFRAGRTGFRIHRRHSRGAGQVRVRGRAYLFPAGFRLSSLSPAARTAGGAADGNRGQYVKE